MKKLLIIALLVVGCAPTTATFYIGMPKEEFKSKNQSNIHKIKGTPKSFALYQKNENIFSHYYYFFIDDTLYGVYLGDLNYFLRKPIDYDKYATPP